MTESIERRGLASRAIAPDVVVLVALTAGCVLTEGVLRVCFGTLLLLWPVIGLLLLRASWWRTRLDSGIVIASLLALWIVTALVAFGLTIPIDRTASPIVLAVVYVAGAMALIRLGGDSSPVRIPPEERRTDAGGPARASAVYALLIIAVVITLSAVVMSVRTAQDQDRLSSFVTLAVPSPQSGRREVQISNLGTSTQDVAVQVSTDSAVKELTLRLDPGQQVTRSIRPATGRVSVSVLTGISGDRVVRRVGFR